MSAVLVSVVLKGTDNHRASRAGRDPQPPLRPAPGSAQEHPKIKIQTIPLIERHPKYPGGKVSHAKRPRILHNYSPNTLCFQTPAGGTSTVTQQAGRPQEAVEAEGISEFRGVRETHGQQVREQIINGFKMARRECDVNYRSLAQ